MTLVFLWNELCSDIMLDLDRNRTLDLLMSNLEGQTGIAVRQSGPAFCNQVLLHSVRTQLLPSVLQCVFIKISLFIFLF